ncbi:MAG: hypothetical protein IIC89_09245, partial [Chloroflexi bacterium]|nr:hypothetical protein [Chloroflexota bacterium]
MQAAGLTEAQAAAAEGFTNIDELRKRIGTRAANSFMESNSDTFPEALADYITELERRESRGDELAEALLVGARTQQRLDGLLLEVTTTETIDGKTVSSIDREAYRAGRARIMAEMRGELAAFEDVLDRLRKSDSEIDKLTAEYFELFDAAKRRGEGDQPGSLLIDFDRFNALERDFIRKHGAEKFALIEANALAAPRGASDIERELRTLRSALEQAGFWEIDDKTWAEFQKVNTDNDSIQNANGFGDWRKQQAAHFDNLLQARAGVSSRVLAEALSDEFARDDGDIQLYEAIRNEFPEQLLAYNCSPSFNWRQNMNDDDIAGFQRNLAQMGYRFQFITLAGWHMINLDAFELARAYRQEGMPAFVRIQDREFALEEEGYTAAKHQHEVGAGYFDQVLTTVTGGDAATAALTGPTEER